MKRLFCLALLTMNVSAATAQVASHAPTLPAAPAAAPAAKMPPAQIKRFEIDGKPVARVNGAVLTDRDLVRQMFEIFPYARQHNGFPPAIEPQIRKGALDMIIFEELVYQDARRRNLTVPADRVKKAEAAFREQFPSKAVFDEFLKLEMNGSQQVMREKIRRSLLIEEAMKQDVFSKAVVTPAQAESYYKANLKQFARSETIQFQSISILPPNATPAVLEEARKRAEAAAEKSKDAKSYREFGVLAEQLSDDDFRVKLGDRGPVPTASVPPEVMQAARALKPGGISGLIKLGNAYTIIRLVKLTPAGTSPYSEVSKRVTSDLQKMKVEQLRSALGKRLRKGAKIEKL